MLSCMGVRSCAAHFAGADPEVSVVPTVVQAMMLEYDPRVRHYEVAKVHGG